MKNKYFLFFGLRVLALFCALTATVSASSQIYSTPAGGIWTSSATWVGGIIPDAADDVVITSAVGVINNACNNIYIEVGGILRNHPTNSYSLTVNGYLTNDGIIANDTYNLSLIVKGNVTNNAVMSNFTLTLNGSGNQLVASTQPLTITNFTKVATTGRAIATTGLNFVGTTINLGSDTLEFTTGNSISMDGGYMSSGVLYKSSLPALQITSGNENYFLSITIDAPQTELYGTVLIYGGTNNFKSNVTNFGTLNNQPSNTYLLTVGGNFTNNGTVQSIIYQFNLSISGNLANNGIWTNQTTTLNGNGNQELSMSQPFGGVNLNRLASAGRVLATTGLSFEGTVINFNSDTLEFTTGNTISVDAGIINSCVLYKSSLPALEITSENGTYSSGVTIDAPQTELYGTLSIYLNGNIFKSSVTNFGTLQNYQGNSYTLNVAGNFTNNGTVQNIIYQFTMNISGNVANNGIWVNQTTTLNGNGNQEISMTQPFGGVNMNRLASAGRVLATTGLSFEGTIIDFNTDTLEFTSGNSFTMSGGYLTSVVIYKSSLPALEFTTNNGTYLTAVIINSLQTELNGIVWIFGNNNIFRNNVINFGTLENRPANSYTLTVTGNFTNNGIVKNNIYNFNMTISGNLTNNGIWTNLTNTLNGTTNQELSMSQPFGGENLVRLVLAGRVRATTDISFVGTGINFNTDTLEFTTGNAMTMSGGYLSSCVLYKTSLPALQLTSGNGNYLSDLTIDSPQTELYGTVLIFSNNIFKNNVINYGALQNRPTNSYTLSVIGNFTNSGTVRNNIYNFSLTISGDITNNGTWINYATTLTGTNTHALAFSNRFEGELFTNDNAAGSMTATTDLIFDGTTLDLNDCSFTLANGGLLSIRNGSLTDAAISGTNINYHSLAAYCLGVVFNSDVTLHGIFQAGTGVSFNGSIINNGVMRNRGTSNYGILVQGGIENNGSITDNIYNFTITVLGDIHNNGTWFNDLTILDGTTDQNINLINGNSIQGQIRLDANFTGSSFAWWGPLGSLIGNPDFSGANSQLLNFLDPVTDAAAGEYYCVNNLAEHSRSIFINSMTIPDFSLDITVLLEGPFNGSDLNTQLNSNNFLPLNQPYFDYPWVYPGNESVVSIPSAGIADWVLIELRDATDPNSATSSTKVAEYAGFLLDNGKVAGLDGISNIVFHEVIVNNLYVIVRHRNHLDVMSSAALVESGGTYSYNFTTGANQAYGTDAQNEINTGIWGMKTGDGNGDGTINLSDKVAWSRDAAKSGYYAADYMLKGYVNNQDKNDIWLNKLGEQSQIP
jgi:hypothetical protein